MPTIFTKIINREIPSEIVFQDDRVTAFKDINPLAPVHILIVPNVEIPTVDDVTPEHEATLGHLFVVAQQVARQMGIGESGYRLIVNCKGDGGQEVFHLHMHLMGGRPLGPMLKRAE
jgi:histidine triad (HIT) family protein